MLAISKDFRFVLLALLTTCAAGCGQSDGNAASLPNERNAPPQTETAKLLVEQYGDMSGIAPTEVFAHNVTIETEAGQVKLEGSAATRGTSGLGQPDPETGQMLWRARTCNNPACQNSSSTGEPFLFVKPIDLSLLDETGKPTANLPPGSLHPPCPKCGQTGAEYLLPEVVARQAELDEELKQARAARRAHKTDGTPLPPGTRTPNEINRERALLPRLYLPEDKYAN